MDHRREPFLISIIIPSYNRRDLTRQAIDSIRAGNKEDVEVIVVDDGSSDGTLEYLQQQPDIRPFSQENAGPSAARNYGASVAKGDYLAFLDSDDLWFPWTLQTYRTVIEQTEAAFIAGKPLRFAESAELQNLSPGELETLAFRDYLSAGDEWRWWGCSSFLIRREAFEKAGGFTNRRMNAEDADLAMRLGTAGPFVQITSPVTFAYREHAVSEMKNSTLNVKGAVHLLETQLAGGYPGGSERRREQWRIIARHLRPVALSCLQAGQRPLAWRIYRATLPYHLRSCRWKFLLGFPLKALS
jgi:GT2 family glycosyltransferase